MMKLHHWYRSMLIGFAALAWTQGAQADWREDLSHVTRLKIGPLCVSDMPDRSITVGTQTIIWDDSTWYRVSMKIPTASGASKGPGGKRARLWVLSEPAASSELQTCQQVAAVAKSTILEGNINAIEATGWARAPTGGASVQLLFPPGQLAMTVGRVNSGLQPLFGSTLDLAGSRAWITNPTEVKAAVGAGGVSGDLMLETTGRQLNGVKFRLGEGPAFAANLVQAGGNLKLRVSLGDGTTRMEEGYLQAVKVNARAPAWTVGPGLALDQPQVQFGRLALSATKGQITVLAEDTVGSALAARFEGDVAAAWGPSKIRAQSLVDPVADSWTSPIRIAGDRAAAAELNSTKTELSAQGTLVATGESALAMRSTGQQHQGTLRFRNANLAALPLLGQQEAEDLLLSFAGEGAALRLEKAEAMLSGLAIGPLHLDAGDQRVPLSVLAPVVEAGELRLPIHVDLSLPKGKARFSDGKDEYSLEAELPRFKLDGLLALKLPLHESHFDVPGGGLELSLGVAAARKPLVAGGRPEFVKLGTAVGNAEALTVGVKSAEGAVQLEAEHMLVVHPVLELGEAGGKYQLATNWESQGGVAFDYDLGKRSFDLVRADLVAQNIQATQQGTAPIKMADLSIDAGNLTLDRLQYTVDTNGGERKTALSAAGLKVTAKSVTHGDSAKGDKPFMLFEPLETFEIQSFMSTQVQNLETALKAEHFEITGLQLYAPQGVYRDGKGTEFKTKDGIRLAGAKMTDEAMNAQLKIGSGELKLGGDADGGAELRYVEFQVSGPKNNLVGDGRIRLGELKATFSSTMDVPGIPDDCAKPPVKVYVKGFADADAEVKIEGGQFKAVIQLQSTYADLYNSGHWSCTWKAAERVVAKAYCVTLVPAGCFIKCWSEVRACTPAVWVEVYIKASIGKIAGISMRLAVNNAKVKMAPNPKEEGKTKTTVCLKGFKPLGPAIDGTTYSPQIKTSVGGVVDDIVNEVVDSGMHVAQTLIRSTLENFLLETGGAASLLFDDGICP